MSKFILNIKKSPNDFRDWYFRNNNNEELQNLPLTLDYRPDLLPIRNQGIQGTCYAQSAACMKEWQERKDKGLDEHLSPQFFYNNRYNLYDNNSSNDEGMFGRDVMKILKEIGICKEKDYKYGIIEDKKNIKESLYLLAKNYCIKSYAQVDNLESLKLSLYNNGPCLIAFPVYNNNIEFWLENENDNYQGGHAMTVVGYLEDCFIIRNSWGSDWGYEGYCYYYFKDWGKHWEIWTTIDIPNSEYIIKQLDKIDENYVQEEEETDTEPEPNVEPEPDVEPEPEPEEKIKSKDDIVNNFIKIVNNKIKNTLVNNCIII